MKAKQLLGLAISGVLLSGAVFAGQSVTAYTTFDQEDARQDEIKREKEVAAAQNVYSKLAKGEEVSQDDLMDMSGTFGDVGYSAETNGFSFPATAQVWGGWAHNADGDAGGFNWWESSS